MKKRKFDHDLFGMVCWGVYVACLIYLGADKIAQGSWLAIATSILLVIAYIVYVFLFFRNRKKEK